MAPSKHSSNLTLDSPHMIIFARHITSALNNVLRRSTYGTEEIHFGLRRRNWQYNAIMVT